ncbi:hypothetical protein [Formosa sp. PL04]|uniref:hypothetical protein n=1 Tax=Formosa sp. PL04 TaxID=3081755 RepID=UPI0029813FC3|nr:hypothetical protein [Formosa sp. PL04]MDW5287900.1 hypothetical protein [Formosa sp. PL04]
MKANLAPKYIQSVNGYMLLWFELSNQYTVVDNGLFYCIQTYLEATDKEDCVEIYTETLQLTLENTNDIYADVERFLTDRNTSLAEELKLESKLDLNYRIITKSYTLGALNFEVYFQTEALVNYIHPQLSHLESSKKSTPDFWFDIYEEENQIKFFKNNQFIKACESHHFHELQGKFNMELICSLYNTEEHDWIGLFHASTISNNKESVMLIGTSGSGKSTLTTILTHNGYHLIADDTTPILRADLNTYYFPGGISVKPGAFPTIKPFITNFDKLPQSYLRAFKGGIKYIATPEPEKTHVPCQSIVLVNYNHKAEVLLETIDAKTALEILIPDSWISPQPKNAKAFLDWISTVTFYKLTYSNNQDAIDIFSTIFENE